MKSIVLWSLVALNAILLYCFVGKTPSAYAVTDRPSDYLIVPGVVQGSPSEVVYIVDTTNGILGGMAYDEGSKKLQVMPALPLARIFEAGGH